MSSIFSVPELAVGVGLSEAASAAFEPKVEVPKQTAWLNNPQRLPDVGLIAALVAGGKVSMQDAQNMAARLGFDAGTLNSLTWLAQNRLDFPMLLRLWRRFGAFDSGADATLSKLVDETLAHEQLDWDYQPWLRALKHAELAGIGDIAYGVVRGILPAPSWVPVAPPASGDKVPRFPQVQLDPLALANALGYDENMLKLMVGRSGLSMAPVMAAQALFRNIIGPNDFLLAIAEGDLRTEWAEAVREVSRQILTSSEYAELQLRGFIDAPTRRNLTQQHGMSDADSDRLYDVLGRAPALHAVTTGLARGATYDGTAQTIPEPYLSAVQRANIRPEWYSVEYENRYTYPSAFVLRALATAGDLGGQQAVEQVLLEIGWKPSFAQQVSTAWTTASPTGAKADPHVTKAQNQLWATTYKGYVNGEIPKAAATTDLGVAGVSAAAAAEVLTIWDTIKAQTRRSLSAAQIKKAWTEQIDDPALGRPWTETEAVTRLQELGYTADDARILLVE